MIKQNMTFNSDIKKMMKKMIGCELNKILHDEFTFTNSVYGKVTLFINNETFNIINQTEVVEFYGEKEDIALLSLKKAEKNDIGSFLENKKQVYTPINKIITSIDIINYYVYLDADGDEYDNTWTEGVIFNLNDSQLAFERSGSFAEMIGIYKGYDLISKFIDVSEYGKEFKNPTCVKTDRNIIEIK